jgi:hypothetical protein
MAGRRVQAVTSRRVPVVVQQHSPLSRCLPVATGHRLAVRARLADCMGETPLVKPESGRVSD